MSSFVGGGGDWVSGRSSTVTKCHDEGLAWWRDRDGCPAILNIVSRRPRDDCVVPWESAGMRRQRGVRKYRHAVFLSQHACGKITIGVRRLAVVCQPAVLVSVNYAYTSVTLGFWMPCASVRRPVRRLKACVRCQITSHCVVGIAWNRLIRVVFWSVCYGTCVIPPGAAGHSHFYYFLISGNICSNYYYANRTKSTK